MNRIEQPKLRSKLRSTLGREYYILKRKAEWMRTRSSWAGRNPKVETPFMVFEHRSIILRPLRNVDMQLQHNKRRNLELAIKHLDGLVIAPGETFSIWKNVGRPTQRKGYLEGLVLKQGQICSGTGGGLCQLGNLLFWIFSHSPLTITERYRHGFDVFPDVNRKVPFGAGATLSYNHIDLQALNKTKNTFRISLWLDDTHLNGRLESSNELSVSFSVHEADHLIQQQQWGGYSRHNRIYRKMINPQGNEQDELLVENHAIMMYEPFLSDGSGS